MELRDTIKMMQSDDYKERFIAEYHQTKIRYEKLKAFNNRVEAAHYSEWNNNVKKVEMPKHDCPDDLLKQQQHVMGEYLHILEVRAELEHIDLYGCRDCTKCKYARKITDGEWRCDAEEYDTVTLSCFIPKE